MTTGALNPTVVVRTGAPRETAQPHLAERMLRSISLSPEVVTPDARKLLEDMRLDVDLHREFERALQPFGVRLSDEKLRNPYGTQLRDYTMASGSGIKIALLQLPDWVLKDGNSLGRIDEMRYGFRGKTVRVVCRGLDAPSAGFNALRRDWQEREQIDLKFVPWMHLCELAGKQQELGQVLEMTALDRAVTDSSTPTAADPTPRKVRVFVSYAHHDAAYVHETEEPSLVAYLKGTLAREGIELWWDKALTAGDSWDEEIKEQIATADIAIVLVSQRFLNSKYCIEDEVKAFLSARKASGLVIFPVILSACDWQSHEWLKTTQFEPREGRTIEKDYQERGKRDELYLSILNQLRRRAKVIRGEKP